MSDDKGKENRPPFEVDDILAEYSSGKYRGGSKVVEFPDRARAPQAGQKQDRPARQQGPAPGPAAAKPQKPPAPSGAEDAGQETRRFAPPKEKQPAAGQEGEKIPEIVPHGPVRTIGARLSTLLRRADNYADHMYDQAEPDAAVRKAEKYLPGVDREETSPAAPRRARPARRTEQIPPDTPPAELAARLRKGLNGQRLRLMGAFLLAVSALLVSLDLPALSWAAWAEGTALTALQLRSLALAILLAAAGLLCMEIPAAGVRQLATLRPRAESILLLSWLFTLADCFTAGRLEARYNALPCAAVTAFALAFALWGVYARRKADRVGARLCAQVRTPCIVTLDENKWNARPAFAKQNGTAVGFGSQLQMEDGGQRAYRVAAPLLILGALLCALLSSVGRDAPGRFLWAASCCFTAASAWPALLVCALPYSRLAARLDRVGAALAGWPGAARCAPAGIVIDDQDLFPTGSVEVTQVNVFGGAPTEKVVAYTATLLRALDCGLTRPFHDLLRARGAIYREISGFVAHEGGASAVIRNQEVLVGTAAFMHMMEIPMPPGHNIRNAIFCAIDGQLCGLFPLNYTLGPAAAPSLSALIRAGISPVLATRDPNLIPAMLEQKFHLPVDKLDFPAVERRLELSSRDQDHDPTPVAILSREGIAAYCDAVVGGRRLRQAVRWGLAFALAGAAAGLALTFYLTSVTAFASLTTVNFLVFMAAWLVPELVIANWVNQF